MNKRRINNMKKNLTEIVFILDKSGSMYNIKEDAIGGFNSFIKDQKKIDGETKVTLVLFDHHVTTVIDAKEINEVEELTELKYKPSGMTSLLDAIGLSIVNLGRRLRDASEDERPENVIFAIMTDGEENMSQDYTLEKVNEMVSHQAEIYDWQFIFLGANIDAVSTANSLGINGKFAGQFVADGMGTKMGMSNVSAMTTSYRNSGVMSSYVDVDSEQKDD
jgi:uncharacterized protein YegL